MNATPRPWTVRGATIWADADAPPMGHEIIANTRTGRGDSRDIPNAELIVRAVNSYDAMRELINQNDDLLAELSQYVSDEHIRLIAEQRKRNNDTLDRIEEGEINQ